MPRDLNARRVAALAVVVAATLPYVPTLDNYFVQDDFGVVGLLSSKPAFFFPRWFVVPWMENIWGYTPDELRPFVALTYQVAAQWSAGSPVPQHLLNVALHAGNAVLVLAIAQRAAGVALLPAAMAAVAFAVLPMQTESVAWVTGRVDSMPTFFYLLAFYLYVRWRQEGGSSMYVGSVAACFVALFSKQNTITLAPALLAYDVILGRGPASAFAGRVAARRDKQRRPPVRLRTGLADGKAGHYVRWRYVRWRSFRPYVPFVVLTAGYLVLRYEVFGQVARESMLSAARLDLFAQDVSTHLRRMVFGEPGLSISTVRAATWVGLCVAGVASIGMFLAREAAARTMRATAYFLIVWMVLGIAPTLVAGYASPRHMYLASVGWAISLGLAFEVLWAAHPRRVMRLVALSAAAVLLTVYTVRLSDDVRLWETRSMVSRLAVVDIEREAFAAPPGTLIIAGAPRRSWDFALPHALRPPYTREDLSQRVTVVSDSSIHCCPAIVWEPYTREALRAWLNRPDRPPVIALYWNPDTGVLSRVSDREDPYLRALMKVLLDTKSVAALDEALHDMLWALAAPRVVQR